MLITLISTYILLTVLSVGGISVNEMFKLLLSITCSNRSKKLVVVDGEVLFETVVIETRLTGVGLKVFVVVVNVTTRFVVVGNVTAAVLLIYDCNVLLI